MPLPQQTIPQVVSSVYNVGTHRQLAMVDESGKVFTIGKVLEFHATPEWHVLEVQPINDQGRVHRQQIPKGVRGRFTVARQDGRLDYLNAQEAIRYYAGLPQRYFIINEITTNPDGTMDQFIYYKCNVRLTDAGTWRADAEVHQTFEFDCEQIIPLSAPFNN